jgi:hypothetical protein
VSSVLSTSNVNFGSYFGSALTGTCLTRSLGSCRVLADVEGAKRAFAFTTGMAALAVVTHLVSAGVCPDLISCLSCHVEDQSSYLQLFSSHSFEKVDELSSARKKAMCKGQLFTLTCNCRLVLLLWELMAVAATLGGSLFLTGDTAAAPSLAFESFYPTSGGKLTPLSSRTQGGVGHSKGSVLILREVERITA